jgi:hypothetical protein
VGVSPAVSSAKKKEDTVCSREKKIKENCKVSTANQKGCRYLYILLPDVASSNSDLPRAYLHYLWMELLMERKLQNELRIIGANKLLS